MNKKPISVTLSSFELALLQEIAKDRDRSLSYVAGHAIEYFAYHGNTNDNGIILPPEALKKIEKDHLDDNKETSE